jgi:hypothetical protein
VIGAPFLHFLFQLWIFRTTFVATADASRMRVTTALLLLTVSGSAALQLPLHQRFAQQGVKLTSVESGEQVALTSLWNKDEVCVVEMLRHFG